MSRKLVLTEFATRSEKKASEIARSTRWAFAAAVSVLLIATLVINRSATAVVGDPAGSIAFSYSEIELQSLVDGEPRRHCIDLDASEGVHVRDLSVNITLDGDVDPGLELAIVSGDSFSPGSCERFDTHVTVFDGSLADLTGPPVVLDHGHSAKSLMLVIEGKTAAQADTPDGSILFSWEVNP